MSANYSDLEQISAVSRIFSATVYKELAQYGVSPLLVRLFNLISPSIQFNSTDTVANIFDEAFNKLKEHRNEYVYKAAIIKKILLGRHSLRTASLLSEFRVGLCRADLVVLNGEATVYEIKSERDTIRRLVKQIETYSKVFTNINVIASENHKDLTKIIPNYVGIMRLTKRDQISIEREATPTVDYLCDEAIFDCLRASELLDILKHSSIHIQDVPNTQLRKTMWAYFKDLDVEEIHPYIVKTLKHTRNQSRLSGFINQLPQSLHTLALSTRIPRHSHEQVINAVNTPFNLAMGWR